MLRRISLLLTVVAIMVVVLATPTFAGGGKIPLSLVTRLPLLAVVDTAPVAAAVGRLKLTSPSLQTLSSPGQADTAPVAGAPAAVVVDVARPQAARLNLHPAEQLATTTLSMRAMV
jgi:hypothetical protein